MNDTIAHCRHRVSRIVVPVVFLVLATGCGSTEPVEEPDVTALVGNVRFESQQAEADISEGRLRFEARNNVGASLRFDLNGDSIGVYALGNQLNHALYTDLGTEWVAFGVNAGELVVSELTESHVAGTFGFRGKDTAGIRPSQQISSGIFTIDLNP